MPILLCVKLYLDRNKVKIKVKDHDLVDFLHINWQKDNTSGTLVLWRTIVIYIWFALIDLKVVQCHLIPCQPL